MYLSKSLHFHVKKRDRLIIDKIHEGHFHGFGPNFGDPKKVEQRCQTVAADQKQLFGAALEV